MGKPLYNTDIIPLTSRPTLTVMDDGDYFVILDTSTGKISKILRTNIMTALKISYDNTSGLTAETVQAALDELVVNLGSTNTVIESLKGVGWTDENLVDHEERLDTIEGTGEGSVAKAIDDAVSPLAEVVDTNRLYSDSQYLDLKAKYDAQQIALNASKAELYTDDPILQYGAVEIIGDGYEANDTPIDVSANVVDGKLDMEQKGLTITNLVENGDFSVDVNEDNIPDGWILLRALNSVSSNGMVKWNPQLDSHSSAYNQEISNLVIGDVYVLLFWQYLSRQTWFYVVMYDPGGYANGVTLSISTESAGSTFRGIKFICAKSSARLSFIDYEALTTDTVGIGNVRLINLTALGLDHITDTDILAKLLPYVDGTKAVGKMGIQILDADDAVTQTIFLPAIGNSLPNGVADSIKTVADRWEHSKRVSTPASVGSGVAVNTTNYPTAKNGGQWVNELTAGGTEIGVVGTDSTTGAGMLRFELATPIVTKYDLPIPTSGKTIHRFAGEEKIALYGTGFTFSENVLSVLSAVKFVAGVMTDITSLATITTNTVTFSGVNSTDVVYVKVEHDVDRPLGVLEHTPAVSNTASRLASLEARVTALEV